MDVRHIIETYIVDNILFGDGAKLRPDMSFQESRILDSLGFLDVITFMEQSFDIEIAADEIVPANFDTLRQMAEFVRRKREETTVLRVKPLRRASPQPDMPRMG